jgi:protein-S-isoprenylcysteine O-methyltransferase Ste14
MLMALRHILSILLLPCIAVVVLPVYFLRTFADVDTRWSEASFLMWLSLAVGPALIIFGCVLFIWCVSLFIRIGRGTLAPWDPTQSLVTAGPYRYVRNPMISGVATILMGLATFLGSWVTAIWTFTFVLVNTIYFIVSEEPGLEKRFGESYRLYKQHVPRWIPRRTPWQSHPQQGFHE